MLTKQIVTDAETNMKKAIEACRREFAEVRTGRANPSLVEGLHVACYGESAMLLKQVASISAPDARLIIIQPWDASIIGEIESAILKSNLGITPANDGKVIRLAIPTLSKERREELTKVVKDMAEEARVSLRTMRRDANDTAKKLEQDKKIPEDDRFKAQDEIQKITDKYIKIVDQILQDKEKELLAF